MSDPAHAIEQGFSKNPIGSTESYSLASVTRTVRAPLFSLCDLRGLGHVL